MCLNNDVKPGGMMIDSASAVVGYFSIVIVKDAFGLLIVGQ